MSCSSMHQESICPDNSVVGSRRWSTGIGGEQVRHFLAVIRPDAGDGVPGESVMCTGSWTPTRAFGPQLLAGRVANRLQRWGRRCRRTTLVRGHAAPTEPRPSRCEGAQHGGTRRTSRSKRAASSLTLSASSLDRASRSSDVSEGQWTGPASCPKAARKARCRIPTASDRSRSDPGGVRLQPSAAAWPRFPRLAAALPWRPHCIEWSNKSCSCE